MTEEEWQEVYGVAAQKMEERAVGPHNHPRLLGCLFRCNVCGGAKLLRIIVDEHEEIVVDL